MKRPLDGLQNAPSSFAEISTTMRRIEQELRDRLTPLQKTMRRVVNALQELPQQYRHVQPYLADRGWFLGGRLAIGDYQELAKALDNRQHNAIESIMQELAKSRIDEMLRAVQTHWPMRLKIVRDAVEAHRQGKYTLSIPALLAQSDGICHGILAAYLFTKRKREGTTESAIQRVLEQTTVFGEAIPLGVLQDLLLDPLKGSSSIRERTDKREEKRKLDPGYGPLNRHGVLHGIDLDYPTEANGLRAIVILDYLVEVKQMLSSHAEHAKEWEKLTKELS